MLKFELYGKGSKIYKSHRMVSLFSAGIFYFFYSIITVGPFFYGDSFTSTQQCPRVVFPLSKENANRKDDYIVDCPDLIQPLFPHSHFPHQKMVY